MKRISVTSAFLLLSSGLFAQGFYLKLGLGYAFPQAGQTLDGTSTPYNGSITNNNGIQTYSIKGASLTSGMQGDLGVGYMFSEHVGAELGADIGLGSKKYTFNDNNISIGGVAANASIITQAKTPIILTPSLVLQTAGDKLNLYSRLGLALPLKSEITQDEVISNLPGTGALEVDDYTFKVKNSFSLGFAAAAGVRYKLNDHVSLWGEVSILSLSVYTKESDLTSVTSNGSSVPLSQVGGPQKVTYSKTASVDSSGAQQPTYSQPFSNVGIKVGVTFSLSSGGGHSHKGKGNDNDLMDNKPYRRR